jgi:G:T-mismatch repair DNA endonuclease (very short patch repair protein)
MEVRSQLEKTGWRVFIAWECDIEKQPHLVAEKVERFLNA